MTASKYSRVGRKINYKSCVHIIMYVCENLEIESGSSINEWQVTSVNCESSFKALLKINFFSFKKNNEFQI